MTYPRPIPPGDEPFYIVSHVDWNARAPWTVVRRRDRRAQSQGSVYQCLRWVNVWGPMHV